MSYTWENAQKYGVSKMYKKKPLLNYNNTKICFEGYFYAQKHECVNKTSCLKCSSSNCLEILETFIAITDPKNYRYS